MNIVDHGVLCCTSSGGWIVQHNLPVASLEEQGRNITMLRGCRRLTTTSSEVGRLLKMAIELNMGYEAEH